MPHKHKRKRDDDESHFNLPPDTRAKSLPVIQPTKDFLEPRKRSRQDKNSGRVRKPTDDTPKSFARLMAWHKDGKKLQSGLDNGNLEKKSKKRKQEQSGSRRGQGEPSADVVSSITAVNSEDQPQSTVKPLQILPGETLAEFNVRVDQSMPLSAIPKQHAVNIPGVRHEHRLTKHNKRLARIQSEWRNTEAKLREKEEEEAEAGEEKREEEQMLWIGVGKPRIKGKKKRQSQVEDDPWKQLEKKRAESKQKNLQDVVQAPPTLDVSKLQKMQKLFKDSPKH